MGDQGVMRLEIYSDAIYHLSTFENESDMPNFTILDLLYKIWSLTILAKLWILYIFFKIITHIQIFGIECYLYSSLVTDK